ncbi:sulfur carrier protein ThiS [bacterium]|nr:sulfur carrier protein ThiS [bacterium]
MILVNGEELSYFDGMTISDILKKKNFIFPLLVVKVDGEVIAREKYSTTLVSENAKVQIIHLISGG